MSLNEHITKEYTTDEIRDIIAKCNNDTSTDLLYSNSYYEVTTTNPSRMNDYSWWSSYDISNNRCFHLFLVTGYKTSTTKYFVWNCILRVECTHNKNSNNNPEGTIDYVRLYNWTLNNTVQCQYTIVKRNSDEPQFYYDRGSSSLNYTYKLLYSNGNYTMGYNCNTNSNKTDIANHFVNSIIGYVPEGSSQYIRYRMIIGYKGKINVQPSVESSSMAVYSNKCYIISPSRDLMNRYVDGLIDAVRTSFPYNVCTSINLYNENDQMSWESSMILVSYVVSERLFTVLYELNVQTRVISAIATYRYNGRCLTEVARTRMTKAYTVRYMDNIVETEPSSYVTSSEINLDVTIRYNESAVGNKYTLVYSNCWYNYVVPVGDPEIVCIMLIR